MHIIPNTKGFSHHLLLPVLAIFIVAGIGVFTIKSSSAALPTPVGSAPSCGAGYKLYKQKKNSDGKVVTKVYYKRDYLSASSAYKFTFCTYFKQTYGKAKGNRILISGPNHPSVGTAETTGAYSDTAKFVLTKKKQCVGVAGVTKIYKTRWAQLDYYQQAVPMYTESSKQLCSW